MSVFTGLNIRPLRNMDIAQLEHWRTTYPDAALNLPKGYTNVGVESAVAESNGSITGSLTATAAVIIDPYIHNPDARGIDAFLSVYSLDRTLCYQAQRLGAVAAYTSVPRGLIAYHDILRKSGYVEVAQNCLIFRRPFTPDI